MRRVALLSAAALLAGSAQASAATPYSLSFDTEPTGTSVTGGPGGLEFEGSARIFEAGTNAGSPPNALRRPGNCPTSGRECATGDHRLVMLFANPARTIALKTGNPLFPGCFEFSCPAARMAAFDADGNLVGLTSWTDLMNDGRMSHSLALDAGSHVIRRAVLAMSEDPVTGERYFDSHEVTAQVDDLAYNVQEPDDPAPPDPPVVNPPTVNVSEPAEGAAFATTDVTVSGTYTADAGLADTCVVANGGGTDFPSSCRQAVTTRADGTFSVSRIPGMRPGANAIRVWVRDTRGRVASDSVNVTVANGDFDFKIETLEITQGIQVEQLPSLDEVILGPVPVGSGSVFAIGGDTYDGVPLAAAKRTVVRMYGAAGGAGGPVRGTPALLHGYRRVAGRLTPLSSSPLVPIGLPDPLVADPSVPALRASAGGSFNFLLPSDWTRAGSELILAGEIAPSSATSSTADCCRENNHFGLTGINFTAQRSVTVYPVSLPWTDAAGRVQAPPAVQRPLFDDFQTVLPAPTTIVETLPAMDVSDIVPAEIAREDRDDFRALDRINARLYDAFRDSGLRGKIAGHVVGLGGGSGPGPTSANGAFDSGLDFVAHEVGHSMGLAHAHSGDGCSDENEDGAFDGPVSRRGPINGVGLDTRLWSGGATGRFAPIGQEDEDVFDATPDAPANVYDYMSYCSNEGIGASWVSARYWANQVREFRRGGRLIVDFTPGCCFLGAADDPTVRSSSRRARGAQGEPLLHVSALVRADGAEITKVETGRGSPTAPSPGSDVEIVVRNAAGAEVSRTPVAGRPIEARPLPNRPEPVPSRLVSADVPAAGARRVEIVVGGVTRATRDASPSAPRVDLRQPAARARIRGDRRFTVRWSARDPDQDALSADVAFSRDGGHSWVPLGSDITAERLTIHGGDLPRTRNGQLRVVVADGFNASAKIARGLRADGSRPTARIVSPAARTRVRADSMVLLEGEAFDDAGRALTNRRLVWRSAGRRIGRGAVVDVPAHRLGRTVELLATDRFGRSGRDRVRLRVQRVEPILTTLVPRRLAAGARTLRLQVASSVPARLTISGKGIRRITTAVGPDVTRIKTRLTGSRRSSYVVNLMLVASKRKTSQRLTVERAG